MHQTNHTNQPFGFLRRKSVGGGSRLLTRSNRKAIATGNLRPRRPIIPVFGFLRRKSAVVCSCKSSSHIEICIRQIIQTNRSGFTPKIGSSLFVQIIELYRDMHQTNHTNQPFGFLRRKSAVVCSCKSSSHIEICIRRIIQTNRSGFYAENRQ